MGKYDLSLARKIIEGSAKLTEKQEAKVLAELSARRAERLSPAATAANNDAYGIIKSKDAIRKENIAENKRATDVAANIDLEQIPYSDSRARSPLDLLREQNQKDKFLRSDDIQNKVSDYSKSQDIEKASRTPSSMTEEKTVAIGDKTKVGAAAPLTTAGIGTSGFSNPLNVLKHGYDKFENVRTSVVDKIMDLTGEPVNGNPHVPQYAKDIYNKGADAILSTATNPLNYVGGAGAVDAGIGAAGAVYDMYSAPKPVTTYAERNPVQQFKVKP